jgi:hypothetical protein
MQRDDNRAADSPASEFRKKREEILRMQAQLREMLSNVDSQLSALSAGDGAELGMAALHPEEFRSPDNHRPAQGSSRRPVRETLLDVLDDVAWPTYSRELSQLCSALLGRTIQPERFGSLANDEMKSFQRSLEGSRVRPVWLCFALTHDRHQPIKRLWARSDWPLDWRIIAPTSGRIQHLKLTAKLCELAQREGAANPEMMSILAADHARDLPGVRVQRGRFELDSWRTIALELLNELEPRDAEARAESAARLHDRGPFTQLFGVPEVEDVDEMLPENRQRRG